MSESAASTEKQGFDLDLSKIAMIVILPLGIWAYYTTFRGMVLLTRGDATDQSEILTGTIGAMIGSAAVVTLMALTSWLLGADLAASFSNQRRPDNMTKRLLVLVVCAFAFFFGVSVFFSYTYYHDRFFSLTSVHHAGVRHPSELNTKFMGLVRETLRKNQDVQSERIRSSDKVWATSISELIKIAGESRSEIEKAVDELRKKISRENAEVLKKAREAEFTLQKNRERRREIQSEIDRVNKVMAPDLEYMAKYNQQASAHEAEADRACQGLDTSRVQKCGPIAQGWRDKANSARAERKKYDSALAPRRKELAGYEAEGRKLDEAVPELQRQIDAGRALGSIALQGEVTGGYLDAILQTLRTAYDFPTDTSIAGAKSHCERLLETIRVTNFATKVSRDFNCLPSVQATYTMLDARTKTQRELDTFNKGECSEATLRAQMSSISNQVESQKMKPSESLPRARRIIEACVSRAVAVGLTNEQEETILREIAEFARQNQTDINVFDRAMNSLRKFDGDFRMAISIAFVQDGFIFAAKFLVDTYKYRSRRRRETVLGRPLDLSDRETDDPEIRAWKALLRLSRPGDGDTSRLAEADILAARFNSDVVENIYGTLNSLGRQDAAWRDRNDIYVIENSAIRAVERELRAIDNETTHSSIMERSVDERDRSHSQALESPRRGLAAGLAPTSQLSTSLPDLRSPPRTDRRQKLREALTGSQEPRSERAFSNRWQPILRQRATSSRPTQPDFASAEPVTRSPTETEPSPNTPAPGNAFDYLSQFAQSEKKE